MKVTIIGGGNIGTAIACYLPKNVEVVIISSKPRIWNNILTYTDKVTKESYESKIDLVTNDYKEAINNSDVIFITHPSFLIEDTINSISPYLKESAIVGIVPGTGGAEFYCQKLRSRSITVFGTDRVPCVSRVESYGKSVIASKKDQIRLATIPSSKCSEVASTISKLLGLQIKPIDNYLTVTLTPSNPILHTSRLYTMITNNPSGEWKENVYFYKDWDNDASEVMLKCDEELHKICNSLDKLDMSGVISLKEHYNVNSTDECTAKIKSIETLGHILSPMVEKSGAYIIDKESRYFTEDIPYGLVIIKGFAVICKVNTPQIDRMLEWFQEYNGKEYFVDGIFNGKDLKCTSAPQQFGIDTLERIYNFYN